MTFAHFNFNVSSLRRSPEFYRRALDLEPTGQRTEAEAGSFVIVYLKDGRTGFCRSQGPAPGHELHLL